jgi:hypothetical protein
MTAQRPVGAGVSKGCRISPVWSSDRTSVTASVSWDGRACAGWVAAGGDGGSSNRVRSRCVVRPWPLANWKREEPVDEAKPFTQRPNIGSRVTREGHARFWERPEVQFLRATRRFETLPTCRHSFHLVLSVSRAR